MKKLSRTNKKNLQKNCLQDIYKFLHTLMNKFKVWAKFVTITSQCKKFYPGKFKPQNMVRDINHLH